MLNLGDITTDFLITNTSDSSYDKTLFICFGVSIVVGIVLIILGFKLNVPAIFMLGGVLSVIGSILFVMVIIAPPSATKTASYDLPAFQEWASDTYMLDVNETQAQALLENAANEAEPYVPSGVFVKTFDGKDAIASLYHNKDEWRLIVTENIAVPTQ